MAKYSIITPSYNSWEYMGNYLRSLENQTYKDFEVIIVDDKSTDDTYNQLVAYARKSALKITVLQNNENEGPGAARNLGMDAATGKWITFVDSDDWVSERLLEKVDDIVLHYNVNCIVYDYNIQRENSVIVGSSMYGNFSEGIIPIAKCISMVRNHVIGKFYLTEKCRNGEIYFPKLKRCEDVAFVCRAIDACGTVYYLKEPLYYYYQRSNSLSNDTNLDAADMVKAYEIIKEELAGKYPEEICAKSISDLLYGGVLMMVKAGKDNVEIRKYINIYEKQYPSWYQNDMIDQLGKAKKIFLILIRYRMIAGLRILAKIHTKLTS